MTNLNQKLRGEIINSVILRGTTIPQRKEDLIKRTRLKVREICLQRVPAEFYPATKSLPAEWFPHLASVSIYPNANPESIVKFDDEYRRKQLHWGQSVSFEPIKHPFNVRFDREHYARRYNSAEDNPESWEVLLAVLIKEAKDIRADEEKARAELATFLVSVKTIKQALEKMPELEGHLPKIAGKPMPLTVPVAPILKTLGKLGFDQSEAA